MSMESDIREIRDKVSYLSSRSFTTERPGLYFMVFIGMMTTCGISSRTDSIDSAVDNVETKVGQIDYTVDRIESTVNSIDRKMEVVHREVLFPQYKRPGERLLAECTSPEIYEENVAGGKKMEKFIYVFGQRSFLEYDGIVLDGKDLKIKYKK